MITTGVLKPMMQDGGPNEDGVPKRGPFQTHTVGGRGKRNGGENQSHIVNLSRQVYLRSLFL